jgi:hypothetical protein
LPIRRPWPNGYAPVRQAARRQVRPLDRQRRYYGDHTDEVVLLGAERLKAISLAAALIGAGIDRGKL